MELCGCPAPTSLVEIVAQQCGVDFRQIQRYGVQRYQLTPSFTPTTILDLSEWQDLAAATDSTKIVFSPIIDANPIIEAGEAITVGGGSNDTLNGAEEIEGVNPSKFSSTFKSLPPATEAQMKKLMCEKNLTVYFFLQGGRIACVTVGSACSGFLIQSYFLSDRNNAGFGTKDTFKNMFSIASGWSESLSVYKPTWNPLTDL